MSADMQERVEFQYHLDLINTKRAGVSAVVLSLFLPCILMVISLFHINIPFKTIVLISGILIEIIQVLFVYVLFGIIKNREAEKFRAVCYIYYALTMMILMIVSGFFMTTKNSEIFYMGTCIYFICVPVFSRKERLVFISGQTLVMLSAIVIYRVAWNQLLDMVIIQAGTIFMAGYQHNLTMRCEKITQNLKKKTICSEQDDLTGLANRRGLEKKAEPIWSICQRKKIPVAMIALDIDYFKKYNDKFGHPQGDRCIKIIASTLKETARRNSDIITRTGGEEFLIFLQDISPKDVLSLALKIRKNIDEKAIPHAYCALSKNVTVSMGIATIIPKYDYQFNDLYEAADRELYLAKQNGRNCIVFDGNLYGRFRNGMAQVVDMK